MLEVKFINENGAVVTKSYSSPYLCRKFINKALRSKRIKLVSYPNLKG